MCLTWVSDTNTTTMTLSCDALKTTGMGPTLNWCGVGINPTAKAIMYPAEAYLLIPNAAGTSLVVENRLNAGHAVGRRIVTHGSCVFTQYPLTPVCASLLYVQVPLCYATPLFTLLNSSITVNATSGGQVLSASWSRPRYLDDPNIITQGHVNLTGTGQSPTSIIAAAAQSAYTAYAPCDSKNLQFHTFFQTGETVNWDE